MGQWNKLPKILRPKDDPWIHVPERSDLVADPRKAVQMVTGVDPASSGTKATTFAVMIDGMKVGELKDITVSEHRIIDNIHIIDDYKKVEVSLDKKFEMAVGKVTLHEPMLEVAKSYLKDAFDNVTKILDQQSARPKVEQIYMNEQDWRGIVKWGKTSPVEDLRNELRRLIASPWLNEEQMAEAVEILMGLPESSTPGALGEYALAEGDFGIGTVSNVPSYAQSLYTTGMVSEKTLLGCLGIDLDEERKKMQLEKKDQKELREEIYKGVGIPREYMGVFQEPSMGTAASSYDALQHMFMTSEERHRKNVQEMIDYEDREFMAHVKIATEAMEKEKK